MKILILNNHTSFLNELQELFQKFGYVETCTNLPQNISDYDLIVLSGGNQLSLANHPEKYNDQLELVKNSPQPIIGICLGAEIIAYAYDSQIEFLDSPQKGLIIIDKKLDHPILNRLSTLQVYESHKWAITKLGSELINLAESDSGIEIFHHSHKPQYGFQFHPEMLKDKSTGDEIIENLIKNCLFRKKNS